MVKKLKMGMVGGGQGAFIGAIHRYSALLDNKIELVCGAFSSTSEKSIASGIELGIEESRCYANYKEMLQSEQQLPIAKRIDFVSIVTPNHMHFPIAKLALESGFHVICDKPATLNLEQALELKRLVSQTQLLFALTHTYTGYPMVKEAKQIIKTNQLGKLRKVVVEYSQGWLTLEQASNNKQASWRTNPETSGISGCMGDIGSHAANLVEYITGESIEYLCTELTSFVDNRVLDDDGISLIKMSSGIKGVLQASQIAAGEENNLLIKVYGEKGGLEWHQQEPNSLILKWLDQPMQILRTASHQSGYSLKSTRTPAGHPEGYIEAFANIYNNFSNAIVHYKENSYSEKSAQQFDYPNIDDGVHGMALIEGFVKSHQSDKKWFDLSSLISQ